jgi:hypothetical protein
VFCAVSSRTCAEPLGAPKATARDFPAGAALPAVREDAGRDTAAGAAPEAERAEA